MPQILFSQNTCLTDVMAWEFLDETAFLISKTSSFEPGVQGVAVAALRTIAQRSIRIHLVCDFDEPISPELVAEGFFGSTFGFSFARLAHKITFTKERVPASVGFKTLLGTTYVQAEGCLGDGKLQALMCVDPRFPIPARLQSNLDTSSVFPAPSTFAREIQRIVKAMGFSQVLTSAAVEPVVTLAYELFKNTFEHGIPTTGKLGRSTRAIIFEKIVLQNSDITRRRLSDDLKNYLLRVNEGNASPLKLGVLCITVVDQGLGIQSTLPSLAGEQELDRLVRAFKENESRKPIGAVARGHGLARALHATFALKGMLQICSAGIHGVQDFSLEEMKYPTLHLKEGERGPNRSDFGTSISIFIPELSTSLDQAVLFA